MATLHGLSWDRVIALSDAELARLTYEFIGRVDDHVISDGLYFLATEAFERFAPDAERAELERSLFAGGEDLALDNLADALAAMRSRQAARLIRDTFAEGGEDDA